MKKLFCLQLTVFAFFLFSAIGARAQDAAPPAQGQAPAASAAIITDEPPLTSSDIQVYKAVLSHTVAAGTDESKLAKVYADAAQETKTTEEHAIYVLSKISIIQAILAQPDSRTELTSSLSGSMVPTDAEIKLVSDHLAELY
ncbi:MAG: hypothetical protein LBF41_10280 [Deltaproteobacteria bacterium]|jgi:hypothetical protein|nr:hypothetical protein [Deltaproteobacteria bacterium]